MGAKIGQDIGDGFLNRRGQKGDRSLTEAVDDFSTGIDKRSEGRASDESRAFHIYRSPIDRTHRLMR